MPTADKTERTPYVTVAEAARILGVHPQTVYGMVRRGELTAKRAGRAVRVARKSLDAA